MQLSPGHVGRWALTGESGDIILLDHPYNVIEAERLRLLPDLPLVKPYRSAKELVALLG